MVGAMARLRLLGVGLAVWVRVACLAAAGSEPYSQGWGHTGARTRYQRACLSSCCVCMNVCVCARACVYLYVCVTQELAHLWYYQQHAAELPAAASPSASAASAASTATPDAAAAGQRRGGVAKQREAEPAAASTSAAAGDKAQAGAGTGTGAGAGAEAEAGDDDIFAAADRKARERAAAVEAATAAAASSAAKSLGRCGGCVAGVWRVREGGQQELEEQSACKGFHVDNLVIAASTTHNTPHQARRPPACGAGGAGARHAAAVRHGQQGRRVGAQVRACVRGGM